jgi:manganese/zinc/iron transport system substrate-binding protein
MISFNYTRRAVVVLSILCALLAVPGCGGGPPAFTAPPVRVLATTTMVADLAARVGGDRVQVEALMGPGVDPHRYQPTATDLQRLRGAHLVFFNGLHLEGKMADLFTKSGSRMRAVGVAEALDRTKLRAADADGGEHDPHVWFDVKLWAGCVAPVRDALAQLDPAGAAIYRANADAYLKELEALDAEVRAEVEKLPAAKRKLVTSHDAFGYFGRAYGFEVKGLQGVSTASETGSRDRDELARYLGAGRVPAVFTETSVPDEGLKAVLETCRRDYKHDVKLIGGDDALYSDALGASGTPTGTYAGMVRHNVKVIVAALRE